MKFTIDVDVAISDRELGDVLVSHPADAPLVAQLITMGDVNGNPVVRLTGKISVLWDFLLDYCGGDKVAAGELIDSVTVAGE